MILVLGIPAISIAVFVACFERHRELEGRSLSFLDETVLHVRACSYMLLIITCYILNGCMTIKDVPMVSLGWIIFFLVAYKPAIALARRTYPTRQ